MKILVFAECKNGKIAESSLELFGLSLGGDAAWEAALCGDQVQSAASVLGAVGATTVHVVEQPHFLVMPAQFIHQSQ